MAGRRGAGEGSIFKRQSTGRWVAQLDLGIRNGRRRFRTVSAETRREAAEALTKMLREQQTGTLATAGRQTVGEYLEAWLQGRKSNLRPSTRRSYAWLLRTHIAPEIGGVRLEKLQPADVRRMLQRRLDAGLAPRSVHHMRAVLRAALHEAQKDGLIARNVAALADSPAVEGDQVTTLTPDEAGVFLAAVSGNRLEALYRVALGIGLRRGEALGLRWQDVDLDARQLHVVYALQRVEGRLQMVPPKTRRSRRTVSLPGVVIDSLRERRRGQVQEQLLAGARWSNEHDLVFTTTIGTPLDPDYVSKEFARQLERAGLRHIRFHDLRHSCASLLLAQGVPMRVVMEVLGHSTITLTANTYSHVLPSLLSDAATAMDKALGQQPR